jgi:hypothetical protein
MSICVYAQRNKKTHFLTNRETHPKYMPSQCDTHNPKTVLRLYVFHLYAQRNHSLTIGGGNEGRHRGLRVAAKEAPQPTRLHRDSNPNPPLPAVRPLPLHQHTPRHYCFHKYINLNVFFINPNGFRLTYDGQKKSGR